MPACNPARWQPAASPMIRFLLRFIGLCLLATAFFFFVYDGTKSIANQHVVYPGSAKCGPWSIRAASIWRKTG